MKPVALIVEDRPEIANIWAESITPLEVDIVIVDSLKGAIETMSHCPPPSFILLDLRLTDSLQDTTIEGIKTLKGLNPDAAIIVISGLLTPKLAQAALMQGAAAVAEKMDMQKQTDLWRVIQSSLRSGTATLQEQMKRPLEILESTFRHSLLL